MPRYDRYGYEILPSWEDGLQVFEAGDSYIPPKWYSRKEKKLEQTPREEGYSFGAALATVFVTRPDNAGYVKIIVIARQFAKWCGYRSLDDGSEYIDGFVDGFWNIQPKQITEEKKEK